MCVHAWVCMRNNSTKIESFLKGTKIELAECLLLHAIKANDDHSPWHTKLSYGSRRVTYVLLSPFKACPEPHSLSLYGNEQHEHSQNIFIYIPQKKESQLVGTA